MEWNVSDIKKYEMVRRFIVQFINSSQVFAINMDSALDLDNFPLSQESVEELATDFLDILLDLVYIFKIL